MKRLAFAILALLISGSLPLAAQETQDEWFWDKPVAAIQWEGLKKANRNELDSLVRSYIGKPFTQELWLEMQASLYELDWFETIEPQALPFEGGRTKMTLRFIVAEKPSVLAVRVTGNSGVRAQDILGAASIKAGDIFNNLKADLDDVAIKKLYTEKGYPDAKVSHEAIASGDSNQVTLAFTIDEGSQVSLRKIKFTGNSAVSERTLKGQITLKEAALFQSGAYQEAKLEESRKAIVDYYQSKGYVDVKILDVFREYEKDENTQKNWLVLTFALSEGRQWKFAGMQFEGNQVFSDETLAQLVTLKPGTVLNYRKLVADKQKIDDQYYESGYIYNQIALKETRDEAAGSIGYAVTVTERDRAHIESLSFKGNEKTKEYVLARELPLEEGDVFSKGKIMDGLRNLYNLQYFSAVEPEIYQGSGENLMALVINVEETSTATLNFGVTLSGLGKSDSFPLSGFVKWNDRNLGGTGQNLQANVTLSPTEQSIEGSFSEGWLFGKRISRGFSLKIDHSSETTGQDVLGPIFTEQDIPDPFIGTGTGTDEWSGTLSSIPDQYLMPYENLEFSLGFNLGYTVKTRFGDIGAAGGLSAGLGMVSYDEDKYRAYEAEFRETNKQWLLTDKVYVRGYLNKLDYWYNPSRGYYVGQRFTVTGFLPIERQHYMKTDTRLDAYTTLFSLPITDNWKFKLILMGHAGYQALLAQPWSEFAVTKDWVSLDGTFNIRGWDNLLGSKGTALWENSLELRMPIVEQALWMDLFLDSGVMKTQTGLMDMTRAIPSADASRPGFPDISWDNLAFSTGLGFRFVIPQFPFRFYFAKRFTFDGTSFDWKTEGMDFDFVLSITQPLY
jgi:outer membrane protein insertion porin family